MVRLSREIAAHIVEEYGSEELLRRLSDPHWFQAFGCVLGFDWHSSGVTTTVCGALKKGLRGTERDLGIHAGGGKGRRRSSGSSSTAGRRSQNATRRVANRRRYRKGRPGGPG
jgi:hypothetical protein